MRTPKQLRELADKARVTASELEERITSALLNDRDADDLEQRRQASLSRADQLDRAVLAAEEQAERDRAKARRAEADAAMTDARRAAEALYDVAEDIDAHLAVLDLLHERLSLATLDLGRAMRLAGEADGRLPVGIKAGLRYALHKHAEGFATDVQSSRVPATARQGMLETAMRLTPRFADGADR